MSAESRLNHNTGSYKLLNGTIIADDWTDLSDGTLDNPINITELNNNKNTFVWTDSFANGSVMQQGSPPAENVNCNRWSNSSDEMLGIYGDSSIPQFEWSFRGQEYCNKSYSLYCFEQ